MAATLSTSLVCRSLESRAFVDPSLADQLDGCNYLDPDVVRARWGHFVTSKRGTIFLVPLSAKAQAR